MGGTHRLSEGMTNPVEIRNYVPADWVSVCHVHDLARVHEVACVGEAVVGFVSWNGDFIRWLYVDPAYHRSGVGQKLLARSHGSHRSTGVNRDARRQ